MAENQDLLALIHQSFESGEKAVNAYSPLTLAYIGDAVYELVMRTFIVERGNKPANDLHKDTVKYVKAEAQSKIVQKLLEEETLTEEEQDYYRRGRNAKSYTVAKNASVGDYRKATGFEALMGYLYLTGQTERLVELCKRSVEIVQGK